MTWYKYDDYGWYIGELEAGSTDTSRATELAPQSLSTDAEVGQLRSIFFGTHWVLLPYTIPVEPPEDLTVHKSAKKDELYNELQSALESPIDYLGNTFPTDNSAVSMLTSIMALERLPVNCFWWTVNKLPIPVESMDFIYGLSGAIADRSAGYYNKLVMLSVKVEQATTHDEIDDIKWSS